MPRSASLLPMPRGLTREEAAAYCGCGSVSTFDGWMRKGIVPGPIPGTKRWDRKAIDLALDRASSLPSAPLAPANNEAEAAEAFDQWLTEQQNAR